ncbi:RING finger protein 207 [Acipenser ruthenus]|uniref:RING finger protein 207 n=1 Tax=Acipenser ruthenus TaxID=7906 RepID=A0A444UTJ3_ACIRT|nr:RING finger protein 207 [Acipenser ruthenus]
MSGGIFSPLDNLYNLDNANCHPLVCHLCHEQYEQPCLLDCYHTFCASCLRGRALDSRLTCPLCRHQSIVKGINALPPEDKLLKFLVDNSADCEETVQCANCDLECKKQPLCGACREDTHKAKMFSRHEIVSLAKRTKEIHKKCSLHEELYIMFSTEKKSMLCINCFRDTQVESRAHCIDIETAYMQGCEKLDQAVLAVKELQTSAREAIVLLKAMIEEVRDNVDEEETAISTLFNNMQEKLAERKKILLKAARSQHEEKERAFKEQLSHLAALLPTLQVHLVSCSAFLSSANKFEFLDLGYQLMERLKKIVKLPHRLRPTQSCKINTEYRSEFARCLEPLLLLSHRRSVSLTGGGGGASGISNASALLQSPLSLTVPSSSDMSLSAAVVRKPTAHRYISTKVLLAEGDETPFTEHCRSYENKYRVSSSPSRGTRFHWGEKRGRGRREERGERRSERARERRERRQERAREERARERERGRKRENERGERARESEETGERERERGEREGEERGRERESERGRESDREGERGRGREERKRESERREREKARERERERGERRERERKR